MGSAPRPLGKRSSLFRRAAPGARGQTSEARWGGCSQKAQGAKPQNHRPVVARGPLRLGCGLGPELGSTSSIGRSGRRPRARPEGPPHTVQAFVFYTNGLVLPGRFGGALPLGSFRPLKKSRVCAATTSVVGVGRWSSLACMHLLCSEPASKQKVYTPPLKINVHA